MEEKEAQKVSNKQTRARDSSARKPSVNAVGGRFLCSSRERVVRVHVTILIQLVFMFLLEMHLKSQLILNLSQLNTFV